MSDQLRQRIAYLVTHGGFYPEERPKWLRWVVAVLVVQVLTLVGVLLLH